MSSDLGQQRYKLGLVSNPAATLTPWQHRNVYEKSTRGSVQALVIGKSDDHIGLIQGLLDEIVRPVWIMYVLLAPHALGSEAAGRYATNHPVEEGPVRDFFNQNYDFFERDARHQIWVTSDPRRSEMLVWDQRDRVTVYGPMDVFIQVCQNYGLTEGPVKVPPDLKLNYHAAFDADERRIVSGQDLSWTWTKSPLQPADLE